MANEITIDETTLLNLDALGINYDLITLSGTVDISIDKGAFDWLNIDLLVFENDNFQYITSCYVDMQNKTWSAMIPPFEVNTTLCFSIYYIYDSYEKIGDILVKKDGELFTIEAFNESVGGILIPGIRVMAE